MRESIRRGYLRLAKQLKELDSKPDLYVMIPPPLMMEGAVSKWASINLLPGLIREMAAQSGVKKDHIIDLQEVINVQNAPKLLSDFIHPTDEA